MEHKKSLNHNLSRKISMCNEAQRKENLHLVHTHKKFSFATDNTFFLIDNSRKNTVATINDI